ncbi:MAG: Fe-S-containing protein [Thermincolia bacterium]
MSREEKHSRVMGSSKKSPAWLVPGLVLVGAGIIAGVLFFTGDKAGPAGKDLFPNKGTYQLQEVSYPSQDIAMKDIPVEFKDGKIYVNLADIQQAQLARFEIPNQPTTLPTGQTFPSLPILSYVAPSGRLVAAVSFCEPCSGDKFTINGSELACNACSTKWTLEDLIGTTEMGCPNHPPDEVNYTIEDGKMVLDEKVLRSWQPRPL